MERAIGVRKHCFWCLSKSAGDLQLQPTKCCALVVLTALLHNMALTENIQLPEGEEMLEYMHVGCMRCSISMFIFAI